MLSKVLNWNDGIEDEDVQGFIDVMNDTYGSLRDMINGIAEIGAGENFHDPLVMNTMEAFSDGTIKANGEIINA